MAKSKDSDTSKKRVSYISVPSQIISSLSSASLQSLIYSPNKSSKTSIRLFSYKNPALWFLSLFLVSLYGMVKFGFNMDTLSPYPCGITQNQYSSSNSHMGIASNTEKDQLQAVIPNGVPITEGRFDSANRKNEILIGSNQLQASTPNGFSDEVLIGNRISSSILTTTGLASKTEKDEISIVNRNPSGLTLNEFVSKNETLMKKVGESKPLIIKKLYDSDDEFWKQPDGLGYKPCLDMSKEFRKEGNQIIKNRNKYLLVVVSGGMNQQRNQIVDAIVIARILGAALVVPILQVNLIWGDESEFADIFDLEHFKRVLAKDVRIVSSLPSTHIMKRPVLEYKTPLLAAPEWIRAHYQRRINREKVLLLRGLDSRLSKDLPSDLQKLRCKAAFEALRFAPQILELGNTIAERMRSKGPYLALHLRMEKDVWVRTGCLPGLAPKFDEIINAERKRRPELLTAKSNMTCNERKLAGLCPLNAVEVTRLLKGLGAPETARIYWAGGQPLGGKEALLPLTKEFQYFYNKYDIALSGELEPFKNKASVMAAIDFVVCEKSDVFMPSHGGNMAHTLQGQRAYAGHKKFITPNKRHMIPYFLNTSITQSELNIVIKQLHQESYGQPELRNNKGRKDVTKFPVLGCMCNKSHANSAL